MLESNLVEALRLVEVLDFKLFDPLAQNSVHLAHVDKLVVDFVDSGRLLLGGQIFS